MEITSLWDEFESVLTPMLARFRSQRSLHVEQKPDATLLSEADGAVQSEIIRLIRATDPDGVILGEEGVIGPDLLRGRSPSGRTWIIDPIDGTAQFVNREAREFCSVVCLLEDKRPVAAFVLAPEIGPNRTPVCVRLNGPGDSIQINGTQVGSPPRPSQSRMVSVTRSSGTPERAYERRLAASGYQLKTRTTSQTLDMVRTSVDLSPFTDLPLESFGLFYREQQKIWDGAAGLCFAYAAGLYVAGSAGRVRSQIDIALDLADPVFESTLIASDSAAAEIVVAASKS